MASLTADDRTWCGSKCNITECDRHPIHIQNKEAQHLFAMLGETAICPIGIYLDSCIQNCPYREKVFAQHPGNLIRAVRRLVEQYCRVCDRAERQED